MLLCASSGRWGWRGQEQGVDLAGDVALEAAQDLAFAEAFGGAALDVASGWLVVPQSGYRDDVEGAVGGAVAASAEPVAAAGRAAVRRLRCDAAQLGEGGLASEPLGVVAGGDE